MIKEFKVANYFSIYEAQTISFSISKEDIEDESSFKTENGNNLNSIITVIGNSASGKTNILKALSFLLWFAQESYKVVPFKVPTGIETHKLNPSKDADFELIFENNGKEYEYKLSLSRESVNYESLKVKNENVFNAIYEIKKEEDSFSFSEWALGSINDVDKGRFIARKNISMFSFLLSTGHLPAIGIKNMVMCNNKVI